MEKGYVKAERNGPDESGMYVSNAQEYAVLKDLNLGSVKKLPSV